ncbi:MAG: hypothetical protein Q8O98_00415 [bacterium]|nr:hypothetical protein [bacterium]
MKKIQVQIKTLPDVPGVYYFLDGKKEILYIGKATSLKDRVKSYFSRDLFLTRGPLIEKMTGEIESIKYLQTDSVLEALILEAQEIKKHQPYFNSREKDDKSYNFVIITKEDFPRVLVRRGRGLSDSKVEPWKIFGPFPHGSELREALKIIRRIFPFRDEKCKILPDGKKKPCFNAQIGLCPGPCAGWITKRDYRKIIKHLTLFFEAKKPELIRMLEKEMKVFAKEQKFEEAEKVKRTLYALDHIQDVALLKRDIESRSKNHESRLRIEAYDIAHISGTSAVGVMVVVEDGELAKSQYRKFRIRASRNNDIANLKEVITRRLGHLEWNLPNLIVVDGGVGQINAAKEVLKERGFNIEVVSVVKDARHKQREIIGEKGLVTNHGRAILLANSDAHRFAIGYHRKLRGKGFRI